jgi:hypothetical protein
MNHEEIIDWAEKLGAKVVWSMDVGAYGCYLTYTLTYPDKPQPKEEKETDWFKEAF